MFMCRFLFLCFLFLLTSFGASADIPSASIPRDADTSSLTDDAYISPITVERVDSDSDADFGDSYLVSHNGGSPTRGPDGGIHSMTRETRYDDGFDGTRADSVSWIEFRLTEDIV